MFPVIPASKIKGVATSKAIDAFDDILPFNVLINWVCCAKIDKLF